MGTSASTSSSVSGSSSETDGPPDETTAVVGVDDPTSDEFVMLPLMLALIRILDEPVLSSITRRLIRGKEAQMHDWVFLLLPYTGEVQFPDHMDLLFIPGSVESGEPVWRPDMGFFRLDAVMYMLALDMREKVTVPFAPSLVMPDKWLVLLDLDGKSKTMMTANTTIPPVPPATTATTPTATAPTTLSEPIPPIESDTTLPG